MSIEPGTARRPVPLPVLLTPIVGRERELGELHELVRHPAHRIVTVTGPAGVGKTRLALAVAESLMSEFDGDVAFVQLSSVQDARRVFPAIGQIFGMLADVAAGYEDQLMDTLRGRRVLILLDNCEQIPDIHLPVGDLLAGAEAVTVLATSQAPIGLAGEQLFPLAPLSTPASGQRTVEEIERSDAVALFLGRARAVNPNLMVNDATASAIAEICRHLDGLPLAIELAAARSNVLSPPALLARLSNRLEVLGGERRDVPDRLRTMRHAISWSYELLSPDEQWLFRYLAVFEERFSLESVEAIFERHQSTRSVIDVLGTLVDRSLVRRSSRPTAEDRYFMFRTLRDFGLEQLDELGEADAAHLAHAEVMVRLAEMAEPNLILADQDFWLDRLDADRNNLRAAVEWSLNHGHEQLVFRITGAIWRFFAARGLITESRAWLERALAAQGNHLTQHRTKALIGAGNLAEDQRDLDAAQRYFTQARHLAAAIGDSQSECRALIGLGTVEHDRSAYEPAAAILQEALNMARAMGDLRSIAVTLGNLGTVSYYLGMSADAVRYWEESESYLVQIGDISAQAQNAGNLGALLFNLGDHARAERYHMRALRLQREMNLQRDIPFSLINLSETALALGDLTLAHDSMTEAISRLQEIGSTELLGIAYNGRARIAFVEGNDGEAAAFVLQSMEHMAGSENRLPIVENAELMGEICARRGLHAVAVELVRAATAMRQRIGAVAYAPRVKTIEAIEQAALAELGKTGFQTAVDAAASLDDDQCIRRLSSVAREIIGRRHQGSGGAVAPAEQGGPIDIDHNLTPREVEVLTLLAQGNSTAQIAEQLYVSPRTAATHINNILGKLGVNSRTAAVALAMRMGLV